MLHEAELNNPFFYGMYQYFQTEPNNASWLASLGQWNSKGIYTDYYNWVLENVGKDYFKLSTEEYTDYDWVVNTTDETFRLPVKVKGASGSAVIGNGIALGLTNGTINTGLVEYDNGYWGSANNYGTKVGTARNGSTDVTDTSFGITTDPTKSGIETSTDGLTLYFYVGEVLQSANLINAGRALEQLARMKATYFGMPNWNAQISISFPYTAPSDGYLYVSWYTDRDPFEVHINDKVVVGATTGASGVSSSAFIPIGKSDIASISDAPSGMGNSYFYPCKEVN